MARSTSAVPMTERARSMSALGAPDRHPHGEHEVLRRGLTCIQALDIERTARVIALTTRTRSVPWAHSRPPRRPESSRYSPAVSMLAAERPTPR